MPNVEQQNRLVEWFRRWRTPLRRFLASRNAVRPADFDDVAQEVFLRLLRYDAAQIVEHPEIAARLGVSFRIVRRDFEKSYGKLRRELDDELTRALQYGHE